MKAIIFVSLVGMLFLAAGCSSIRPISFLNATLSASHYRTDLNIVYGENDRQKLDFYYPKKRISKTQGKDKPLIVFVYGGAWKEGDKKDYKFIAHAFTEAGYRVAIPNYRLFPEVKFPLFVDDVADSIAFLENNAQKTTGDLSLGIILMGHSAGAYTAALLTTDRSYFKARGITTEVKGLVALAGPYNLDLDDPEVIPIFLPLNNPNVSIPATQVHSNMPPTLLMHGLKDTRVAPSHTKDFASALLELDVHHDVKLYEKVSHVNIVASIAFPLRYLNTSFTDILDFLSPLK